MQFNYKNKYSIINYGGKEKKENKNNKNLILQILRLLRKY